jgi:hypothetical protein
MWLDEIRAQLAQSRALIVLLTPTSLTRPHWLLFECGFAATNPACEVVPLCLGVNTLADVPAPFSVYQCYQLADYESLRAVVAKLVTLCGIAFDEEMARPVLQRAIADFTQALKVPGSGSPGLTLATLGEGLKEHIDRRFREAFQALNQLAVKQPEQAREPEPPSYSVMIHIKFPGLDRQHYLEIHASTTLQDVLDNVYYMLGDEIRPFTYLEAWLLREISSSRQLIVREVANRIPAHSVLAPNSEWEAVPLSRPYTATDSGDVSRWRYS